MGCCTNFAHFCKTVGIDHFLAPQPTLYFMTPDRRVSRFRGRPAAGAVPPGRAFAVGPLPDVGEKLRIAWGLLATDARAGRRRPAVPRLAARAPADRRTIDRFWGVVLVSALNETVDRVGLRYARKVFRDGFLRIARVRGPSADGAARPALRRRIDRRGLRGTASRCG